MNQDLVYTSSNSATPTDLKNNLPDTSMFDVTFKTDIASFNSFYQDIYEYRNTNPNPYHYGSFQIYSAELDLM